MPKRPRRGQTPTGPEGTWVAAAVASRALRRELGQLRRLAARLDQVASNEMTRSGLAQLGLLLLGPRRRARGQRAARSEAAARGRRERARDVPLENDPR